MSNYTITTNFGAKDSLPSGNAGKVIKGSEFTTEFTNIQTAIATKANIVSPTFTGNTALDGATTFGANGTSTFNGTVNFTKDVTFDTNTLFVDVSENRVGIGTTSPSVKLHIENGATSDIITQVFGGGSIYSGVGVDGTGALLTAGSSGSANASMIFRTASNGAEAERMRIDSSGNVGIGTSSPANTLTVGGLESSEIDQDATVGIKCNTNHRGIILQENSGAEQWEIGVGAAGALKFYDSGSATPAVTFADGTGNVGIGTDSPVYNLDIEADTAQARIHSTAGNSVLRLDSVDTGESKIFFADNSASAIGTIEYHHDSNYMSFDTVATERMRIDSSGNVGIGTSSPDRPLDITDTTSDGTGGAVIHSYLPTLELDDISGSGTSFILQHNATNTLFMHDSTERMRIDSSGNLLVSTTDQYAFNGGFTFKTGAVPYINVGHASSVAGGNYYAAFRHGTNTIGTITQNGTTGINYNTSSDERLKENITDSADAGSKVDAIQIRQFDWKADGSHQDYGVIAQELFEVAPEAVHQPEDSEDMMGVDYSKLVPMLIQEVQSLRSRVAELENV